MSIFRYMIKKLVDKEGMYFMTKMTKWDKFLIIFIIISSLIGLYLVKYSAFNEGQKYIVIEVNGEEYKRISFGPNMTGKIIEFNTDFGHNVIEIGEERVRVIEADCPDKLDVKQGWISSPGEVIVCLPNRFVVQIISVDETKKDYDYISY